MSIDQTTDALKPPAKRGRPSYQPSPADHEQVKNMHSVGLPESHICTYLNISLKTLRKHFRHELATAHVHKNMEVLNHLFAEAVSGQRISAAIFWAKARCGFRSSGPLDLANVPKRSAFPSQSDFAPSVAEDIAFDCDIFSNEGAPNAH